MNVDIGRREIPVYPGVPTYERADPVHGDDLVRLRRPVEEQTEGLDEKHRHLAPRDRFVRAVIREPAWRNRRAAAGDVFNGELFDPVGIREVGSARAGNIGEAAG